MKLQAALPTVVLVALLASPAARAQSAGPLAFTLLPPAQAGAPGTTLHFTGTLSNTTAAVVFLNGDSATLNALGLTLDDTPFLGAPISLAPSGQAGSTYTGGFFDILIGPAAPTGVFSGSFSILGGATDMASDVQASQPFSVTVAAPVPEASPSVSLGLLLALGAGGLWQAKRRKHRAL